jgi:predicted Zn-dependent peptidase
MVRFNIYKDDKNDLHQEYVLENGLRIIYHPTQSKVTFCGFAINVGTRDEQDEESGMAHFMEHLIFKGTKKRKALQILNCLSNVGGDLDAFTNKEDTTVYATVLNEYFERALELLCDIAFHSTFPISEIEKETEVIIDEIQSYEDTPSELIYDEFENIIFKGHPLGRNILGNAKSIRQFGTAESTSFANRFYQPDNMVLFVTGCQDFKKIIRLAQKYTESVISYSTDIRRTTPNEYHAQQIEIDRGTHQTHVILGCPSYKAYHPKSAGLYLINNILGGVAMNNRLNLSLRERSGLVYTVESSITGYTDTGEFCIYFGCDPEDTKRCIRLVKNELKRLREKKLSSIQLSVAKQQLIGQLIIASENDENNALDMAKTYLHFNRYDTLYEACKRIDELTADELIEIANEKLSEDNLTTLMFK